MAKRMFHINIYKCVDYNLSIFKSLFLILLLHKPYLKCITDMS